PNNLTIDGTISVASGGRVDGVLTIKANRTFTTDQTWRMQATSDVRVEANATIDGTGVLRVQGDISQMDGTISVSTLTLRINATGSTFLPEQGRPKNQEKKRNKIDEKSHLLQISLFDFLPLVKS
ncbi:MAG: hypothetical protein IH790_05245, partial [Acidobacteria bacterium]|nr:hypothetical protein [Acidobacteriota bacterium]